MQFVHSIFATQVFTLSVILAPLVNPVAAAPGDLDPTFGTGGIVTTSIGSGNDSAFSVATQSDGKIVVAGRAYNGSNNHIALVRYMISGLLDPTFGTSGIVITPIGNSSSGSSVVMQSDGRIVVAGSGSNSFALVRYTANGSLDPSFGTGGIVTTLIGNSSGASSVVVQSDGKIVVAGSSNNGSNSDFALARYTASGILDPSFGAGGIVSTPIGSGNDYAHGVGLQSDGKIVLGGYSYNGSNYDIALVRYLASGALDPNFGTGGIVTTPIGSGNDYGFDVGVQSDGKIVVAGWSYNGVTSDMALVRYAASGALDPSFGSGGIVTTMPIGGGSLYARSVALQSNGKIVAAGLFSNGSIGDVALLRYTTSGMLDNGFGTAGVVTTPIGNAADTGFSVAVYDGGKIVVAGYSNNGSNDDMALVRYEGDPAPEVVLIGNSVNISNGDPAASLADHTDFDSVDAISGTVERTFTIINSGTAVLNLTGTPRVTLSGSSAFGVTTQPSSATIAAGGTAEFVITFDPATAGIHDATVSIASDDSDEDPFTFAVTGIGLTALESWRQLYFGNTSNSGNAADTFDFDSDNLVNLIEWACHLDPTKSDTISTPLAHNGADIEFTYTRSLAAVNAGAVFIVEWSDTLAGDSWSAIGVTQQIHSNDGTVQVVKASVPVGTGARRFARLKILPPPFGD